MGTATSSVLGRGGPARRWGGDALPDRHFASGRESPGGTSDSAYSRAFTVPDSCANGDKPRLLNPIAPRSRPLVGTAEPR